MVAMRAIVEPNKGRLQGTAARVPFDGIMESVAAPDGVTYQPDHVGGIPGVWCRPKNARPGEAVLHIFMADGSPGARLTLSGIWRAISQPRQARQHLCPTTGLHRSIPSRPRLWTFGRPASDSSRAASRKSLSLATRPVEPWLLVSLHS
jgi:hypothetical protein